MYTYPTVNLCNTVYSSELDTHSEAVGINTDNQRPPADHPRIDKIARYKEGDNVRIEIDIDVLKAIEKFRGTWNKGMIEVIGR